MPRLLTPDQKLTRPTLSQAKLAIFEADQASFLDRFLTQDKRWVHHFEPETKNNWCSGRTLAHPPRKAKIVSSAWKVMASIFWDTNGFELIDYLQKGRIINGEYCTNLLKHLRKTIMAERPGNLTKGVLFHQDNAPVHNARVGSKTLRNWLK